MGRETTEESFEILRDTARDHRGSVIKFPGLNLPNALSLTGRDACRRGEYIPAGPFSDVAPGVERASDGTYIIYVLNPIPVGGRQDA